MSSNSTEKRARVLVAHESATIREVVRRVVEDGGYQVFSVADGQVALERLTENTPDVLVVDVALPRIPGYELCNEIRRRGLPCKVILIASVHQHTAYKRRPATLAAGDDYIEQHHIPDALLPKIGQLLPRVARPRVGPSDPAEIAAIRQAGEGRLKVRFGSQDEAVERARRVAMLIVADIALYQGEEFLEKLRSGRELDERARTDLEEGRRMFESRVPQEVRAKQDFFQEALNELTQDAPAEGGKGGGVGA
jgi:CheY-like chemotaxis protein